jgi:hypothetical protein
MAAGGLRLGGESRSGKAASGIGMTAGRGQAASSFVLRAFGHPFR